MRLLFVVQRYGREVAGGAESCCREFATRLAARGHHVEVLSSCALSYVDWANEYAPGEELLDGVRVYRLEVAAPREHRWFGPLNTRVPWGRKPVPLFLQEEWMRAQGPDLPELSGWLRARAGSYDAVVFFTYLYATTWVGLPAAAGQTTTVLHPTAHDEPPIHLPLFEFTFRHADAFGFLTEEEGALVVSRFGLRRPSSVVGVGVDLDVTGDGDAFRAAYPEIGDRPYLIFLGRLDPGKGSDELFDWFATYKERNSGALALAVVGDPVKPLPPHPDVVVTGFVSEQMRHDALAGSIALVQPSYFESFSMVLTEAWALRKPALVQGHCDVLVGQARRSGGAIPYWGFAEFEASIDTLLGDPNLAMALGEAGRRYVEERYDWNVVLERYEELLGRAVFQRPPAPRVR